MQGVAGSRQMVKCYICPQACVICTSHHLIICHAFSGGRWGHKTIKSPTIRGLSHDRLCPTTRATRPQWRRRFDPKTDHNWSAFEEPSSGSCLTSQLFHFLRLCHGGYYSYRCCQLDSDTGMVSKGRFGCMRHLLLTRFTLTRAPVNETLVLSPPVSNVSTVHFIGKPGPFGLPVSREWFVMSTGSVQKCNIVQSLSQSILSIYCFIWMI